MTSRKSCLLCSTLKMLIPILSNIKLFLALDAKKINEHTTQLLYWITWIWFYCAECQCLHQNCNLPISANMRVNCRLNPLLHASVSRKIMGKTKLPLSWDQLNNLNSYKTPDKYLFLWMFSLRTRIQESESSTLKWHWRLINPPEKSNRWKTNSAAPMLSEWL